MRLNKDLLSVIMSTLLTRWSSLCRVSFEMSLESDLADRRFPTRPTEVGVVHSCFSPAAEDKPDALCFSVELDKLKTTKCSSSLKQSRNSGH